MSERPRVDVRPCVVKHKREGDTEAHKVIGSKQQRDYETKGDVSSPMVLEEAQMPKYVTNAQEQRMTNIHYKIYPSSETEG